MFENPEIKLDSDGVTMEPDSSKEAWEHYKKFYTESNCKYSIRANYDFDHLHYYTPFNYAGYKSGVCDESGWYNFVNRPFSKESKKVNRLYALHKDAQRIRKIQNEEVEWCRVSLRVGGECDFNFNEKKYQLFQSMLKEDLSALEQLERCKKMHHTPLNFSLMQAVGNMQGFKGRDTFDRLDRFAFKLDQYFKQNSEDILTYSTSDNQPLLKNYLDEFGNIYSYFKEIYFIDEKDFVDEIISNGGRPIKSSDDVIRYMTLAEEFWSKKQFCFEKKLKKCNEKQGE